MDYFNLFIYTVKQELNHYGLPAKGRRRLAYNKNTDWLHLPSQSL